MTTPLPHLSLGNPALDISSGVANFARGLKAEKDTQRQEALQQALMNIQQQRADTESAAEGVAAAHEQFGQNQFEKMLPLYQRQTAAEETRAQAALRAASSHMNVARHQQLARELQTAQRDLAGLRQLDLQQHVANQNPRVAALRQAGLLPQPVDYTDQMANAQQRYNDAIDALQQEEGEVSTPRTPLLVGGTPAPSIHPGATPAQPGVATPRAGPAVVQPIIPTDPLLKSRKNARWHELVNGGMTGDMATAQVEREFAGQGVQQ